MILMMTAGTASVAATEISPRDGAQGASAEFDEEVRKAEAAIREYVQSHPGGTWTLRELREATTEDRTDSVMTTAFFNLEDSGELRVDYIASTITANL
jgi:hypothetical protein